MDCDVKGCRKPSAYCVHMSPYKKPKHLCEMHWLQMMKYAKQLEFKGEPL